MATLAYSTTYSITKFNLTAWEGKTFPFPPHGFPRKSPVKITPQSHSRLKVIFQASPRTGNDCGSEIYTKRNRPEYAPADIYDVDDNSFPMPEAVPSNTNLSAYIKRRPELDDLRADLVRLAGRGPAEAFLEEYAGSQAYIPMTVLPHMRIVRVMGLEAAIAFADEYGGDRIEVPSSDQSPRFSLGTAVWKLLLEGRTNQEIVRAVPCSVRAARKYRQKWQEKLLLAGAAIQEVASTCHLPEKVIRDTRQRLQNKGLLR